jgi:predicted HicB family RNase H-like nuclease
MKKRKSQKKSEFLSVRVSEKVKTKLAEMAASQDRSLSWLTAKILEEYTNKNTSAGKES